MKHKQRKLLVMDLQHGRQIPSLRILQIPVRVVEAVIVLREVDCQKVLLHQHFLEVKIIIMATNLHLQHQAINIKTVTVQMATHTRMDLQLKTFHLLNVRNTRIHPDQTD